MCRAVPGAVGMQARASGKAVPSREGQGTGLAEVRKGERKAETAKSEERNMPSRSGHPQYRRPVQCIVKSVYRHYCIRPIHSVAFTLISSKKRNQAGRCIAFVSLVTVCGFESEGALSTKVYPSRTG